MLPGERLMSGHQYGRSRPFRTPIGVTKFPNRPEEGLRRRLKAVRIRYSRWDGSQDPLGPDLSTGDLMEELSDDVLAGQGMDRALSRLFRHRPRGRVSGPDAFRARPRHAPPRERPARAQHA